MGKAYVSQNHKTLWHRNPVSGHEWPEHIPLANSWTVLGGASIGQSFRSEKAAQDHADFLNKFPFKKEA